MQFIDLELSRRVEMAEANAGRECAEAYHRMHPEVAVAVEQIAGGIAVFAGADSPVTQAIGVGLNGPVGDSELDAITDFFHSRGAAAAVELSPFAPMTLYEKFAVRGYRLLEVSNVLVLDDLAGARAFAEMEAGMTIRPARADESSLWTSTVAQGFAEHYPVTQSMLDVMEGFCNRGGESRAFLAFANGEPAGGGVVAAYQGVAGLFGASTLPKFRGRGVQSGLLSARLAWASEHGCDLAVSLAHPGSISHRNIERRGFRVAYTRTKLVRALA
jgi:GNAT superfamily N-acetyltransferase